MFRVVLCRLLVVCVIVARRQRVRSLNINTIVRLFWCSLRPIRALFLAKWSNHSSLSHTKRKTQPRAPENLKDTHFVNFFDRGNALVATKSWLAQALPLIGRENCASLLTNLRMLLSQANAILDHCLVFMRFTWDLRGNSTLIFVSYTTDCPALTSQEWSTKISDFERV